MKHRGFTLIEVLVSLAIFALAAVGLGAAYSSVLQARMALKQDEQYLDDLARTRAAMLETINFDSLDIGGDVNLPGDRKAHWKAKAEPTTVSDLFNVTLTMAIQRETNGEFTPDITETSMLLRPTWSIVSDRQKIIDAARERLFQQRGYNETDPGPGGLVSAPTPYKNPLAGKGKGGDSEATARVIGGGAREIFLQVGLAVVVRVGIGHDIGGAEVLQQPGDGQSVWGERAFLDGVGLHIGEGVAQGNPTAVGAPGGAGEPAREQIHLGRARVLETDPADVRAVGVAAQITKAILVHTEVGGGIVLVLNLIRGRAIAKIEPADIGGVGVAVGGVNGRGGGKPRQRSQQPECG